MWEWVFSRLLGGHITLGKGFDDIAIEPETINNPTHTASTQTPCFKTVFIRTPFIHFFTSQKIKERAYFHGTGAPVDHALDLDLN